MLLAIMPAMPFWVWIAGGQTILPLVTYELSVFQLLAVCLLYPIVEELAFRGAIQSWLLSFPQGRRSLGPISAANMLTVSLFALAHWFSQSLLWALLVIVPGLILGILRERYNRIAPCIVVHCIYNTGFYLAAFSATKPG